MNSLMLLSAMAMVGAAPSPTRAELILQMTMREAEAKAALPRVKDCPCSPACCCGCNEGRECDCGNPRVKTVPSRGYYGNGYIAPTAGAVPARHAQPYTVIPAGRWYSGGSCGGGS